MPALRDDIWNATPDYATAWQPDPGKIWRAIDEACPTHNVRAGIECPTNDYRRPVCSDRMAWLRELIAAGEAGEGEKMARPEREPAVWNPSLKRRPEATNALRPGRKAKVSTETVAADVRAGMTMAQSAEKHGVSFATISAHRKRARESGLLPS